MTSMNIAKSNHNATDLGRPLHGYRSGHQIVPKSLMNSLFKSREVKTSV